jgi:hypothetical protein
MQTLVGYYISDLDSSVNNQTLNLVQDIYICGLRKKSESKLSSTLHQSSSGPAIVIT